MANTIGLTTDGGFIEAFAGKKKTMACKFTAPATMSPIQFNININDNFGSAGTCYVAIYADATGVPGAKLWSGSSAYASLFGAILNVTISGLSLTNAVDYWLVAYCDTAGTLNVVGAKTNSLTGKEIRTWTEAVAGSWTDNPTTTQQVNTAQIQIYAVDTITNTKNNSVKANILSSTIVSKSISSKADLKVTATQVNSGKANVVASSPQNNSATGNIKTTYYTGNSYDWKLSTDTTGQNRGFNS